MIAQSSISRVLETAQIDEVISDYVHLKKRGANFIGLCPFHNEKTPSFTVSPAKGIYKCFGCGVAGNSAKFLMEHEHYSFPEAIESLAEKYQVDLEYTTGSRDEGKQENEQRESIHIVNAFAKKIFIENLETEEGKSIALTYLKERGLDTSTIEKFGIGYAIDQRDFLLQKALNSGYKAEVLADAGLVSKDKTRDFFRNRIMFPIHNLSGKVIAFGGRIMQKTSKAPKYINTPESEVYEKSKVLYGMFLARNTIRREDQCFLVEGYTDVIAMFQAGIENVVASSGTSLTQGQIRLIKRYTSNVTVIYDGDEAGKKAAARGSDIALEEGMKVDILLLPENEDPDSFIRNRGENAFREYYEKEKVDYILFKTRIAAEESINEPLRKAELTNEIINSISRIPDPISRSYYLKECSSLLGLSEQILITESNKSRRQYLSQKQKRSARDEEPIATPTYKYQSDQMDGVDDQSYLELLERDLIRLMMEYGSEYLDDQQSVIHFILEELENIEIDNALYRKVIDIIAEESDKGETLSQEYFLHNEDEDVSGLAIELLSSPYEVSENWYKRFDIFIPDLKDNFQRDIQSSVTRFKLFKLKRMIEQNDKDLKEATDYESQRRFMEIHDHLHKTKQQLSKVLGTVVFKMNR